MIDDPLNRLKVVRGSAHPNAKLTEGDVKLIRELVKHREDLKRQASKLSNRCIAEKFAVHYRTIERITQEFGWVHVD